MKIKNDIKILKFLINLSFLKKKIINVDIKGKISKIININLLNIKLIKKVKANNGI